MTAGFIGSGTARVRPLGRSDFPAGVFAVPANVTTLQITPQAETLSRPSFMKESYGQALDSYVKLQPPQINLTWDGIDNEVLTSVFAGILQTVNETAQTVTDEAVTAASGKWVKLANRHLDPATVVVTDSAGTTTYTVDTDYQVNAELGMIYFVPGGAIADGDSVLVDYNTLAFAGSRIIGAKKAAVEMEILFDGRNEITGENVFLHIYDAKIRPSEGFNFLSQEFVQAQFEGELITPAGKTEPFIVEVK
ncbi:MAG TPA: hypothetical protein ENI90_00030 [Methylothermaceae bacterium]|nr:hypothetical protein [Methylothermaceae bacterium]